jgi:hypothetical protein
VDKALGWQVYRIGTSTEPLSVGTHVPRLASLAKALRAARAKKVPADIIEEAEQAGGAFERLIEQHAGERGSFDAMVRGLGTEQHIHVKDRRAAFRANCNIWGLCALASYSCITYHAGEKPGTEDSFLLIGHVGLHKLRPDVNFSVGYQWSVRRSESRVPVSAPGALGVDFIEEFSTRPFPQLATREVRPGVMATAFQLANIGRAGAVTYFVRHIARAASEGPTGWYGGNSLCRVPVEVGVSDIIVPRGWTDPGSASITVYGSLQDITRVPERHDSDRLPISGQLSHLGSDLSRLRTPLVPKCTEMVEASLRGMGWEKTEYDVYRCVMEYPVLLTGVATRIDAVK